MPESTGTNAASNPTLTVEADIDGVPHPLIARFLFPLARGSIGKIDEHARAANPAARRVRGKIPPSVGCFTDAGRHGGHPPACKRPGVRPGRQCIDRRARYCEAEPVTRRAAMKILAVRLVATLVLALATTTASFAQSRPPACIPQYDASGAQIAPYCGP